MTRSRHERTAAGRRSALVDARLERKVEELAETLEVMRGTIGSLEGALSAHDGRLDHLEDQVFGDEA